MPNKWTYPGFEGNQFKDHLHCEQSSEEHVEDVHRVVKTWGLSMMLHQHSYEMFTGSVKSQTVICWDLCEAHLHGQTDGVEEDKCEHQVFKVGGVDHVPHLVLVRVLGDVAAQRTCL